MNNRCSLIQHIEDDIPMFTYITSLQYPVLHRSELYGLLQHMNWRLTSSNIVRSILSCRKPWLYWFPWTLYTVVVEVDAPRIIEASTSGSISMVLLELGDRSRSVVWLCWSPSTWLKLPPEMLKSWALGKNTDGCMRSSSKAGRKKGRADTVLSTSTADIHRTNHASYMRSRSSDNRYGRLIFNTFLRLSAVCYS